MLVKIIAVTLTDGSKVYDIVLQQSEPLRMITEDDATEFADGFKAMVAEYSLNDAKIEYLY